MPLPISSVQLQQFQRDGYLFYPKLFDEAEISLLLATARADRKLLAHSFPINDTQGRESKLSLWNHPGNDIYGMFARCSRVVDSMEQLLDGEVYHYHSKMMLKEPRVGGAWEWHQDYGYWYQNGCLFPDMASCLIAADRAHKGNGCLQVLQGSHLMGRIEHGRFGEQTGADPERVKAAMKRLKLIFCEMEPGTALFFHANLLHCSAPNTSEDPRWSLICCYNKATNDPYKDSHHPCYTPLKKVADSAILEIGSKGIGNDQYSFLNPAHDKTISTAKAGVKNN